MTLGTSERRFVDKNLLQNLVSAQRKLMELRKAWELLPLPHREYGLRDLRRFELRILLLYPLISHDPRSLLSQRPRRSPDQSETKALSSD
jgi:hypothetical protein